MHHNLFCCYYYGEAYGKKAAWGNGACGVRGGYADCGFGIHSYAGIRNPSVCRGGSYFNGTGNSASVGSRQPEMGGLSQTPLRKTGDPDWRGKNIAGKSA